jgi:multimeric flavodoxin WrbA
VPRLLVVHHTPSPALHAMLDAVRSGAGDPQLAGVEVVVRAALAATATDVLDADGYVLGTPANLGYMAGALKHFFDQIYYPCLEDTASRPYGLYVHANSDATGAIRSVETVATGLRWRCVHEPIVVRAEPDRAALEACWDLGATVAAVLLEGLA